jgi:hypothetical protein
MPLITPKKTPHDFGFKPGDTYAIVNKDLRELVLPLVGAGTVYLSVYQEGCLTTPMLMILPPPLTFPT